MADTLSEDPIEISKFLGIADRLVIELGQWLKIDLKPMKIGKLDTK